MCFSAAGSFALSGILGAVGVTSLARTASRPHRMFAAVPLIFAAQQATEGIVWLTMVDPDNAVLNRLAVSTFLGFALVVWPFWVPLSVRMMERSPARLRVLTALSWFGGLVGVSAALLLARWQPVASIAGHSIRYDYPGTSDAPIHFLLLVAYAASVALPLFLSTARLARTIGVVLVVSVMMTVLIQRDAFTSVWCFFAAILSGLIAVAVARDQRSSAIPLAEQLSPARP